ncbi:hypothetical protein SAMN04488075_1503 [Paracoccus alkenifer]|uniref:Uncharacterized protein n=1 Tax=Paracoccus alkenifer TaxID=65735 RepID=A0A1H6LP03_9RHOB|nr:hypothetical protein SAMN04488075_1503 [Paracoccus alkenifer]
MKRAVRWIGLGITAAAAATMLLADLVLASPAQGAAAFISAQTRGAVTFIIAGPGDGAEYPHKTMAHPGPGTGKAVR